MKKKNILVSVLVFSLLAIPFSNTWGQEKKEKKKEEQMQDQLRKVRETEKELFAIQEEMEKVKGAQHKKAYELYRSGEFGKVGYVSPPSAPSPVWFMGGSENSFSLSLMKSFDGESVNKESGFTVDEDQSRLRLSVNGHCKEGSITVNFILPSGKSFAKIQIDSSADIEWSQSISIEEGSKYRGQWKIEVKAVKAKGKYQANVKSY